MHVTIQLKNNVVSLTISTARPAEKHYAIRLVYGITTLLQKKNRQIYPVWCSRLYNHILVIKKQCKQLGGPSKFLRGPEPPTLPVVANHVFKVGGPIPWFMVLLPFYRKKIDRSTQFGAVGYIITL